MTISVAAQGLATTLDSLVDQKIPLTAEQYAAFGQQAVSALEQAKASAIESGVSPDEAQGAALSAIAPLVESLERASRAYGLELDADTRAALRMAPDDPMPAPIAEDQVTAAGPEPGAAGVADAQAGDWLRESAKQGEELLASASQQLQEPAAPPPAAKPKVQRKPKPSKLKPAKQESRAKKPKSGARKKQRAGKAS